MIIIIHPFDPKVTVRHHKGGLGKSSERVFGISRSYMGIFKVRERGRPLEGKETKGEIIEISHVEGISCENKVQRRFFFSVSQTIFVESTTIEKIRDLE